MNTLGERLDYVLGKTRIRQYELAEKCGITKSSLGNYLNNRSYPTGLFYEKLKKEIPTLNLNWLIVGIGEAFETGNTGSLAAVEEVKTMKVEVERLNRERSLMLLMMERSLQPTTVGGNLGKSRGVCQATVSIRRNKVMSVKFAPNFKPVHNGVYTQSSIN